MDESVDLLEKGFQLAHFILGGRQAALSVLSGALNKLEARRTREKKRAYWRDKHLKRWITSITRSDADILQWLIFFECEAYERQTEASGKTSARDMAVRYVKHLVQATTALSSFHVNVGLSRLLYNYSGAETQRMYELITERYVGTDQYRRAKNLLREKLELRFGRFIKNLKTPQGELRFEAAEDQSRWAQLVRECLTAFTPWSTAGACLVLPSADPRSAPFPHCLPGKAQRKDEFDRIESNRCHVFIEPLCFSRLANWLGFRLPEQALALPQFFLDGSMNREDRPQNPPSTTPLTPEERKILEESLTKQVTRRRRAVPEGVKVIVDGIERVRLSIDIGAEQFEKFEVLEGARLVEIWTEENGEPLLLATQLISYEESGGFTTFDLKFDAQGGATFALTLAPEFVEEDTHRGWITLRCTPAADLAMRDAIANYFAGRFRAAPAYAWAVIVLLSLGWITSVAVYQRNLSAQRIALQHAERELATEKAASPSLPTISTYRLIPDELNVRGQTGFETPVVWLPARPELVSLLLPVGERSEHSYRASLKLFSSQKEILTEDLLTPSETEVGPAVVFTFPSSLLQGNVDYTAYLEQANRAGKPEVVNSFTFHTQNK